MVLSDCNKQVEQLLAHGNLRSMQLHGIWVWLHNAFVTAGFAEHHAQCRPVRRHKDHMLRTVRRIPPDDRISPAADMHLANHDN